MTKSLESARSKKGLTDSQLALFLIVPLVIFQAALTLYPSAMALWMSLQKFDPSAQVIGFEGAGNYIHALTDPEVAKSTLISLEFTAEVVLITVLLGIGGALLLNEQFKGRSLARVLVILPWAVPEYASGVIFNYVYNENYGSLNGLLYALGIIPAYMPIVGEYTIWAVGLAYAWHYTPLAIFFFLGALQSVPEDLYKQAKIDGASALRRFVAVTLPYLRYALLIVLVLASVDAMKALDLTWILTQGGPAGATRVLTYHIFRETFQFSNFGYGAAIAFLLLILIMALTAVYFLLLTRRRT